MLFNPSTQRSARVEDRLRSLENLIASIAGGAGQTETLATNTLSAGELQRVRDAAQIVASPDDVPEFAWINYSPSPFASSDNSGLVGQPEQPNTEGSIPEQYLVKDTCVNPNSLFFDPAMANTADAGQNVPIASSSSWTVAGAVASSMPVSARNAIPSTGLFDQQDLHVHLVESTSPEGVESSRRQDQKDSPDRDMLYR